MKKRILSVILTLLIAFSFISCKGKGKTVFYDKNGNSFADIQDLSKVKNSVKDESQLSYLQIAVDEAVEIIMKKNKCNSKKAKKLLSRGYKVYTSFDSDVYGEIKAHYKDVFLDNASMGCAVTDLNGNLISCISSEKENHVTKKNNPYSAFKPLSVYAPAIEENLICWSDTFVDSPYKKIKGENGENSDWPRNANGNYLWKEVCVCDAIKKSLNTVAVKCLDNLGVNKSIGFLQKNFSISLEAEQKKATVYGNQEIIGNIALGYINEGCSPLDMAGYYQIFANGGLYTKPHAVTKICDSKGKTVYKYSGTPKRVIKETTAYIMNGLLQGVVKGGGTGFAAHISGVPVGGKTGTGVQNDGNWFVGFTPQYVCSVWHSENMGKNSSPEIFSAVMKAIISKCGDKTIGYPVANGIRQEAFCKDSGKLIRYNCRAMDTGYYVPEKIPGTCNIH